MFHNIDRPATVIAGTLVLLWIVALALAQRISNERKKHSDYNDMEGLARSIGVMRDPKHH